MESAGAPTNGTERETVLTSPGSAHQNSQLCRVREDSCSPMANES